VQQQLVNATGQELSRGQAAELDFVGQLSHSSTHKARLLHYFPVDTSQQQQGSDQQQQQGSDEDWCGWHLDHGSLTGGCIARKQLQG
jgi:isopenicillin N synthase-like dioxygenase